MELSYELNEQDLVEVQAQRIALRREAMQGNPVMFLAITAFAGVLGSSLSPLFISALTLPRFFVLWMCAALIALPLTMWLGRLRLPRVDGWSARRIAREAARKSVLGPVTVLLEEDQLVRRNAAGELTLAWSQVKDVLVSERVLTLRLREGTRVILLPTRALADPAAVRERLERLVGRPSIHVDVERSTSSQADASGARVQRRPERALLRPVLLTLLALSVLGLGYTRWQAWSNDPRRSNAPNQVVMYSTAWCPACATLRSCLQRHEVPFDERDVERSERAEAEWAALEGTGIPVTLVGQRVIYGVDAQELKSALAEAGYTADCAAP
jgi:glutaredoxin